MCNTFRRAGYYCFLKILTSDINACMESYLSLKKTIFSLSDFKPVTQGYKLLSVWNKNTSYKRLSYSNSILPQIYASAYMKVPKFEEYFRNQVKIRWDRKQILQKITDQLNFITSDNPNAAGKFLTQNYKPQQKHQSLIEKKVCDLDSLRSKCILEDRKLKKRLEALFDNERLRNWASEEKLYIENQLGLIDELLRKIEGLKSSLIEMKEKIRRVFSNVHQKQPNSSRKRKENVHKAKKEKKGDIKVLQRNSCLLLA